MAKRGKGGPSFQEIPASMPGFDYEGAYDALQPILNWDGRKTSALRALRETIIATMGEPAYGMPADSTDGLVADLKLLRKVLRGSVREKRDGPRPVLRLGIAEKGRLELMLARMPLVYATAPSTTGTDVHWAVALIPPDANLEMEGQLALDLCARDIVIVSLNGKAWIETCWRCDRRFLSHHARKKQCSCCRRRQQNEVERSHPPSPTPSHPAPSSRPKPLRVTPPSAQRNNP